MGFPPKSWFGYRTMGVHAFTALYPGVVMADRAYFDHDFWNVPGYLGANPPASLLKARIQKASRIKREIAENEAVQLGLVTPMPANERGTADVPEKPGANGRHHAGRLSTGRRTARDRFCGRRPGDQNRRGSRPGGTGPEYLRGLCYSRSRRPARSSGIKPGDEVQVDNSNFLAAQTYHRHQVPGKEYPVWDQFRGPDGSPIYPQRPVLLGPLFTQFASGVVPCGKFKGKMIVLACLWDREAFPWQADWYRARVEENLGDSVNEHFRLWYMDHALHADITQQEDPTRTVSYLGALQQALRDLSAWVEEGIDPPDTTAYQIEDGQVVLPPTAKERRGIQPVVTLRATVATAEVMVGEAVEFTACIEVPLGTGLVSHAAWDFEGTGDFPVVVQLDETNSGNDLLTLNATYHFSRPGTYFPVLQAASQRHGDKKTNFAQIRNLDRVRVVVR